MSLEYVLKKAGNNLTRKNIMDIACCNMNQTDNALLLPGTVVKTTKTDHFPIQQMKLEKWNSDHWEPFGDLIDVRSK
jgi:hypothetical protein